MAANWVEQGGACGFAEPSHDCDFCPRLRSFVVAQRLLQPHWFNGPVPSFGHPDPRLLIVGLAPGLQGANRTGRPFTGDHAGELLYATLLRHGLAEGTYRAAIDDGLQLVDCTITNAVRCVPPANKPTPVEIRTCNGFLAAQIAAFARLQVIVVLGRVAHDATLSALGVRKALHPFAHASRHLITVSDRSDRLTLFDSYHCSRYNTNTGVLTPEMFDAVFAAACAELNHSSATL